MSDGKSYKDHPLFSIISTVLEIMLYDDDLEVCNPLSYRTKIHKLFTLIS